ncbi:MAG: transketolase family protein [Thermoplasmata archaeon]|nr:transketolase family protein [Thermoplasmata archaeon]
MTDHSSTGSLRTAYGQALLEIGATDPKLVVLDPEPPADSGAGPYGAQFPDRYFPVSESEPTLLAVAAELALGGRCVFANASVRFAAGESYRFLRRAICQSRADVKFVTTDAGLSSSETENDRPWVEDIGIMRGLPGMTVVVPCDGPSTRAAVLALHDSAGPAYLRLTTEDRPTLTDGSFQIGRAAELRSGSDLTIVAVGAMVASGLEVAADLARVGVSTRVLDFASVKPFDEPALLRAARDTGAILVLEEHTVLTGVGALVASTTSENHPVPVRRVGIPDVFAEPGPRETRFERHGLGPHRIRDEAWELLQLRGKVQ